MNATPPPPRRRTPRRRTPRGPLPNDRRGAALVVAMLLVAGVLVVSVAFLHSGLTASRTHRNVDRTDHARRAARAGALAALAEMQSPDWAGVDTVTVGRLGERDGVPHGYRIKYDRAGRTASDDAASDDAASGDLLRTALRVRVWVEGTHGSGVDYRTPAVVEFVAELRPRTGGGPDARDDRALAPDDWNPAEREAWAGLTRHAVTATEVSRGVSLVLGPQSRVAGDVWVRDSVELFEGPAWEEREMREIVLRELGDYAPGTKHGGAGDWPAPFGGRVTTRDGTDNDMSDALNWLATPLHRVRSATPALPPGRTLPTDAYSLYAGGPVYRVEAVPAVVANTDLGPTADNPLGLFRAAGDVRLGGRVSVRGTIISRGSVRFDSGEIELAAPRWADPEDPHAGPSARWPRLPALLAGGDVETHPDARVTIDGAVIAGGTVTVRSSGSRGGVTLSGTIEKLRGSDGDQVKIDLDLDRDPRDVREDGTQFVRFSDAGPRYPIVKVEKHKHRIKFRCEGVPVDAVEGGPFRIDAPAGGRFTAVGPVAGRRVVLDTPQTWRSVNDDGWSELFDEWEDDEPPLPPFFADPENTSDRDEFGDAVREAGLPLDPVTLITHDPAASGAAVAFSPPLFRPDPAAARDPRGGYRWEVLSWRER